MKNNRYKWKKHVLFASESDDLAEAEKEWVHPVINSYVPDGVDNCLCSARILNKFKIVNTKTGHIAFVGITCLKKIVPKGTRRSSNTAFLKAGQPVEYDNLNIEEYLAHCKSVCGRIDLQMALEQREREKKERENRERNLLERTIQERENRELYRIANEKKDRERIENFLIEHKLSCFARLESERIEKERLFLEKQEYERQERLEQERERKERIEKERLEQERERKERIEKERLEREMQRQEQERERKELEIQEAFQCKRLVYAALKASQLTFLKYEAKKSIKKKGISNKTKSYLQTYMEAMRTSLSNHEWALVLSNRNGTPYETEKIKIDTLFPH
jgi:hypothetical protein